MLDSHPIRVIIDFADELGAAPTRRCFERPLHELRADTLGEVIPTIDAADRLARSGLWVVGFVSYDASPAFDPAFVASHDARMPLAWFAAFDAPGALDPEANTATVGAPGDSVLSAIDDTISSHDYDAAVERIRADIVAGNVYQVNLTAPFELSSSQAPSALYERLRLAQHGSYSAYLDLGDVQVMSASPELFFERRGTTLRSRPMKGTAVRGLHVAADEEARRGLLASEKDRAENVMIVDVVRNDIGRVARTGTVRVASLCEAERYPRVWQLTSTVEGETEPGLPLSRVFGALFPPASVTGAPKIRATAIIQELEREPRAIYCGAIGVIRPGGDAAFNVAIRTAWSANGGRTVRLNAGGGVTIDSTPTGELAELRAKLDAFTVPAPTPSLFETMRMEYGRPIRVGRHLARMSASADYFAMPYDAESAHAAIDRAAVSVRGVSVARCRLLLSPDGAMHATSEPFADAVVDPATKARRVALARSPVRSEDVRLYHKTTDRTLYEQRLTDLGDVFDVLLWNERREATELSRGNLVVEIAGSRWTPPISCGLLAGTLRAELLESRMIRERVVTLDELALADRLWFINSLRGWVPITLDL